MPKPTDVGPQKGQADLARRMRKLWAKDSESNSDGSGHSEESDTSRNGPLLGLNRPSSSGPKYNLLRQHEQRQQRQIRRAQTRLKAFEAGHQCDLRNGSIGGAEQRSNVPAP